MKLSLVISALILFGCTSFKKHQVLNPKVLYMPDIIVTAVIDKDLSNKHKGSGVLRKQESYDFVIESPGKIDLLKVSSCTLVDTVKQRSKGWFSKGNIIKYKYTPDNEELAQRYEEGGECPLVIEAYEKGLPGRHAWASFIFEDDFNYTVDAQVTCCGKTYSYGGVSSCVCEQGKLMSLKFEEPMQVYSESPVCEKEWESIDDGKYWRHYISNRQCPYLFISKKDVSRQHKSIHIGIEEIAVRND